MDTTSDAFLGDVEFFSETYPDDRKIFPAAVLGVDETALTENAALRFARSPDWVITAWVRNKITPTVSVLAVMMCYHHGQDPGSQLMALFAATAFILAQGKRELRYSDMMAKICIAEDLQRTRNSGGIELTPSKKLIDTVVGEDFMLYATAHPHGLGSWRCSWTLPGLKDYQQ